MRRVSSSFSACAASGASEPLSLTAFRASAAGLRYQIVVCLNAFVGVGFEHQILNVDFFCHNFQTPFSVNKLKACRICDIIVYHLTDYIKCSCNRREKMKILLCGDVNSGKSTMIRKLIADMGVPPRGYITVRLPAGADGKSYVYLYDVAEPPANITDAQVIMSISDEGIERHPEYMDGLAVSYLRGIPEGSLVVMDEIGTLESAAPAFQREVMRILSGNYSVFAAVKAQNTEFLRAVRRHPDCELYIITPENRDDLYAQIKAEHNI